jgi:adenylate cyclase
MSSQRKLAAIFAADIAGYSALVASDEEGAVRKLRQVQASVLPLIESFGGRIIDLAGDGILAEFSSTVRAVEAAAALQERMQELNSQLQPRMEFRIGINVGDVIQERERLFGDAVNIAARLEAIASAGGICISHEVHQQIEGKVDLEFRDLGQQTLKNVREPVRAWHGSSRTEADTIVTTQIDLKLPSKPSIAVLPFRNMSGDSEQEYFADGIVEEIIIALSRFRQLFVIARNSSFVYKGRSVDAKRIGKELGVRYILEGSVRRLSNRVRITGELIDAMSGTYIWAERYDRDLSDVFAVQDEIATEVAAVLEPALAEAEQNRVLRKPPESLDAWEAFQRGWWHFNKYSLEDNAEAQVFFLQAINLDRNFAPGHYGLAYALHLDSWLYSVKSWEELGGAPLQQAVTAVSLDPADSLAYVALSGLKSAVSDWIGSVRDAQAAFNLNPNSAWSRFGLGLALGWSGSHEEGIRHLRQAMRLSPRDPIAWLWVFWVGLFQYLAGDYEDALSSMREVARVRKGEGLASRWITACLGQLGRRAEAAAALHEATSLYPTLLERFTRSRPPWMRPEDHAHMLEGLRKAGWKG